MFKVNTVILIIIYLTSLFMLKRMSLYIFHICAQNIYNLMCRQTYVRLIFMTCSKQIYKFYTIKSIINLRINKRHICYLHYAEYTIKLIYSVTLNRNLQVYSIQSTCLMQMKQNRLFINLNIEFKYLINKQIILDYMKHTY